MTLTEAVKTREDTVMLRSNRSRIAHANRASQREGRLEFDTRMASAVDVAQAWAMA